MLKNEWEALVSLLDDPDPEVHSMVVNKIKTMGSSSIDHLAKAILQAEGPLLEELAKLMKDIQYENLATQLLKWKDHHQEDLLYALWQIATYQNPDLSYEELTAEIKKMKLEAWIEFREGLHPYDQVKTLNYVFFQRLNFHADNKYFHSTDNSMIDCVLKNRRSNPIGLCVVYMIIAQELGLPVYGVNLPNVFVLKYEHTSFSFYINVFGGGVILSKAEIEKHVIDLKLEPKEDFFEPCSNLIIVLRILRNLMVSFEKINDIERYIEIENVIRKLINKPLKQ